MLFALTYELEDIIGPVGTLCADRAEILRHCREMTRVAIDHLNDYARVAEWFDLAGDECPLETLLASNAPEEIVSLCSQVNDLLISKSMGYISYWEYATLFDVLEEHNVLTWCSAQLRSRLLELRANYSKAVCALSEEWSA